MRESRHTKSGREERYVGKEIKRRGEWRKESSWCLNDFIFRSKNAFSERERGIMQDRNLFHEEIKGKEDKRTAKRKAYWF